VTLYPVSPAAFATAAPASTVGLHGLLALPGGRPLVVVAGSYT
jgi:hypothetical protein